jgi:hypothetical protein
LVVGITPGRTTSKVGLSFNQVFKFPAVGAFGPKKLQNIIINMFLYLKGMKNTSAH